MSILKIFIFILILSLFIYSKVNSYESQISVKYKKVYSIIKSVLKPILDVLNSIFKPYQIGNNLYIDTSQIILLILLLITL
mgnify:CR=1 FL=1